MIDSPIAISTTSPWRSTKCAGEIVKPPRISRGVIHSSTNAALHSTYCAVPPAIPPISTRPAVTRLYGASPRTALNVSAFVVRANSAMCTSTTIRYAIPNAGPPSSKACGIASARIRNAPMPPSSSARRTARSVRMALVSQT